MPSHYKMIKGIRYDRELIEHADSHMSDGCIELAEAKVLWSSAMDAGKVTDVEERTLQYIMDTHKLAADAKSYLEKELAAYKKKKKPSAGYYEVIDGVKYDRELLAICKKVAADGRIELHEAEEIGAAASDGTVITEIEKATIAYIEKTCKIDAKAKKYLDDLCGRAKVVAEVKPDNVTAAPAAADDEDLPDFDEEDADGDEKATANGVAKGNYAAIHASGFKDFLLKPELQRAIVDCGFEHPSEVQHECIPQAILGSDILCQAKSGMGKTAVFVLACLQQVDAKEKKVRVLVICHTRELAYQIKHEFDRFAKYFENLKTEVVYGGTPLSKDREMLKDNCPQILIGTPGRVLGLVREKALNMDALTHFVLDECDKCLDKTDMRGDVQKIFMDTPRKKQVMMFSATMTDDSRALCKKFMSDPHEISVEDQSKLTLHGLVQYYIELEEKEKNRKLNDLLDALEFNQVVIFVKSVQRAQALDKLLVECNFPSISIHSGLNQEERIARYKQFKEFQKRIMVSTDLFGRGIDIERVNIVINYDMPEDADSYLHRVGRAGRFGTKGLALSFVTGGEETEVLKSVQSRFEINVGKMPSHIETSTYINA